ncbi:MAG: CDP-glycerol glycerophosphotransferase family protein [Bifidobacteriaceae bacterium]|jgi:hypothetical protein|nr:CDP-glycerol glycerophosphotransferase family protein [Bifidobacteriaceae bacterium]
MSRLSARALKLAVSAIRKSGLLPKSIPDGRGDEALIAKRFPKAEVMVFFGDTVNGLYQLRPWYPALRELHRHHPVVIVGTDSRAIATIRHEAHLPAFTISHYSSVDLILSKADIGLVLYVNHNSANFPVLAFPQLVHVSIMHGDSDKVVSVSAQTRAYDFTFVAGQAAIDRLAAHLPRFNAAERCLIIGRPQAAPPAAEALAEDLEGRAPADGPVRVLYAPTWEGGTGSAAYSSLVGYGEQIVRQLMANPRFALTYRPHPLTGTRLPEFADANARLKALIAAAAKRAEGGAPSAQVSRLPDAVDDLWAADLLITDISSLAIDFLVTGRPLAITIPPDPAAVPAPTRLLEVAPRLGRPELADVPAFLEGILAADAAGAGAPAKERAEVARYYLSDTSPGAAIAAFVEACGRMLDLAKAAEA